MYILTIILIVLDVLIKYMSWVKFYLELSLKRDYYNKGIISALLLGLIVSLILASNILTQIFINYTIILPALIIGYFIPAIVKLIITVSKELSFNSKQIKYDNPNYRYIVDRNGFRRFKWDKWYDRKIDELDKIFI